MFRFRNLRITYSQIIAFGYLTIILVGGLLLSLPFASKNESGTSFINSVFTATSATCVTGLVIFDTYNHWTLFGQIIILTLIQIGGLGFMTIVALFSMFLKRKIGLKERRLLMETANTLKIGGVVLLMKKVLIGTVLFESLGTLILAIRFIPQMGFFEGLYNALFHSISAFCNAGFDIMGKFGNFSSLTSYSDDVIVNLTVMALIVIGGIGFIVWDDILTHGLSFRKYQLHSKIVLTSTAVLLFGGALLFYLYEKNNSFLGMSGKEMLLASLFQSVTPRTAGFNTIDIAGLSESSSMLTMLLMFIGGSPGSTAGGIKTTTLVVLILGAISASKRNEDLVIFKRRLENNALKRACSIAFIYASAALVSTLIICAVQPFSIKQALFEVLSAEGTVGLTTGITQELNTLSKLIIMFLMYGGRVSGLSLALTFAEKREVVQLQRPVEKIIIG